VSLNEVVIIAVADDLRLQQSVHVWIQCITAYSA